MGLNLNSVYQRPYVAPDGRNRIKRRPEEENAATANTQREEQTNEKQMHAMYERNK